MSNWKRFKGKEEGPKLVGMQVNGTFRCQFCMEDVYEAEYFQVQRVLRWKCPNGHPNVIEKFDY